MNVACKDLPNEVWLRASLVQANAEKGFLAHVSHVEMEPGVAIKYVRADLAMPADIIERTYRALLAAGTLLPTQGKGNSTIRRELESALRLVKGYRS